MLMHMNLRLSLASSVVLAATAACGSGSVLAAPPESPTATAAAEPTVPSEARVREVLAAAQPPDEPGPGPFDTAPAGSLGYNTSVLGADGRVRTHQSLATTSRQGVRVIWQTVRPTLDDAEADRIARGITPPDPDPVSPPAATRVPLSPTDGNEPRSLAYLYSGQVHVLTWTADGGVVLTATPTSGDAPSDAARLDQLARHLLVGR